MRNELRCIVVNNVYMTVGEMRNELRCIVYCDEQCEVKGVTCGNIIIYINIT